MVKCLICGVEKKCSIVEHLKFEHQLKSDEYKKMFKGSKVNSDDELLKMYERSKKNWDRPEFKKKQIQSRKITHQDPIFRNKMSEKLKLKHKEIEKK